MSFLTTADRRSDVKCGCGYSPLSLHGSGIAKGGVSTLCDRVRTSPNSNKTMPRSRRQRPSLPLTIPATALKCPDRILNIMSSRRQALCRLAVLLATVALAAQPAAGLIAAQTPDAGAFLADLNQRMIEQLTRPETEAREQESRFRALLNEGISIETIGRFVLGRYWRRASKEDRRAFLEVFEDIMVRRFLLLLTENSGARLTVGQVRPNANDPTLVTVMTQLRRAPDELVRVDWRIQKSGHQHKIVDVVIEGVSLSITLRSEYGSRIRREGGDVGIFVVRLREELAAGGFTPKNTEKSVLQ